MSHSGQPLVIGLGEVLWDIFADSRRPGGAPANVAFQASQLGCRGIVLSRVGRDPLGRELLAFLASQGMATECIQQDPVHATGTVTVDTSEPAHPRFVIHEDVAWDYLEFDELWEALAGQAAAICFGTLAQRWPVSRHTIHRVLQAARPGCLIVYDVNLRQRWYQRDWVEASLAAAGWAKLNTEEAAELARLLELGQGDDVALARTLQERYGLEAVCITRAQRGALLVSGQTVVDQPGEHVEVVDTVGAGDAFTAAWIAAGLWQWPPAAQVAFANRVGALVASRPGAMPPLREEFAQLAKEYA